MANSTYIIGMTPEMQAAYRQACIDTWGKDKNGNPKFVPRLVQGYGDAPASKGTHNWENDGAKKPRYYFHNGKKYACALDISIKGWAGWFSKTQEPTIKWFLFNLAKNGFVGWYRYRGSFLKNKHMHIIYVGHKLKPMLNTQVNDFLNDRDGLAGHQDEPFWTAPSDVDELLRKLWEANR